MPKIISNSNPEVATFEVVDDQIIVSAHSSGTTILVYDHGNGPTPYRVNVA